MVIVIFDKFFFAKTLDSFYCDTSLLFLKALLNLWVLWVEFLVLFLVVSGCLAFGRVILDFWSLLKIYLDRLQVHQCLETRNH